VTDPADFLSRWSRRKREAARAEPDVEETPLAEREADAESPVAAAAKPEDPVFDISKLPSIESITAETDIRAFLTPGVPAALRQAALRQAWSADPKIRDFIEMAENQWDFNAPGEILGFDFSAPTGDIKRMIADIYGKLPASESETETQSESPPTDDTVPTSAPTDRAIAAHRNVTGTLSGDENVEAASLSVTQPVNETVRQTLVAQRREENIAPQKNDAVQDSEIESRPRPHGGALPK
jgi:hypothetical protein